MIGAATLPPESHKNSIRHLAVGHDGAVAFGMQWQGDGPVETLIGLHRLGSPVRLMTASAAGLRAMRGYIGSVALTSNGHTIAVTSPRGGLLHLYDAEDGRLSRIVPQTDVCGVATLGPALTISSGTGEMRQMIGAAQTLQSQVDLRWDNHLIPIASN